MAKREKKPATAKKPAAAAKQKWSPAQLAVQEAGKITGDIVCSLQRVRKEFLKVGQLLTDVRDRKIHETLHHDMESYAAEHLGLSPASMYRYMKVYAWVRENRPKWLVSGAKIPDMSAIAGLIWVDQQLEKKGLAPSRKEALEALKEKAKDGKLPRKELRTFTRRNTSQDKAQRKYLAKLRALRREGSAEKIDAKVLAFLDQAIATMENDLVVETAGLGVVEVPNAATSVEFLSRNILFA
jgi:hypothetical protein